MINWTAFLVVLVTSLIGAGVIVTLFSIGVRLLATPSQKPDAARQQAPDEDADESGRVTTYARRPPAATVGAYVCFGLCGVGVLFAVYLIVPLFH
ncbi:hypothetical protein [Spelaeicoccus albus]|uniref:Uncharacterized protein n=1 Tax=Spelaeicoccus albus TaxID=1280376 RepID=A0A7Z0AAL4_9MICO|nr:hypothetical protein [Spelaeicoccus albus]NYI66676.1 hypothetical protein [Spelaeicoccus albus]